MHVIIYFKCLPQICTKMNYLKFDFSKYFLGGAHRVPIPRSLNPVFSRACPSVLASPLILRRFAPSTRASTSILGRSRALRALASSLSLNFRLGSPSIKFFNPFLAQRLPPSKFLPTFICTAPYPHPWSKDYFEKCHGLYYSVDFPHPLPTYLIDS